MAGGSPVSTMRTLDTCGPPVSIYAYPGMRGSAGARPSTSLASRGNFMDTEETLSNQTSEGPEPSASTSAEGQVLAPSLPSDDQDMTGSLSLSDNEERMLLQSPADKAAEEPGTPKPKKLSGAQRKKLMKEKLAKRGEKFQPAKWRPSHYAKLSQPKEGAETPDGGAKRSRSDGSSPRSAEAREKKRPRTGGVEPGGSQSIPGTSTQSYRDTVTNIRMSVTSTQFPDVKLTAEQSNLIEDALVDAMVPLESGALPKLCGNFLERGVFTLACKNEETKKWLLEVVPTLKPWEEASLRVGERKDVLKATKVLVLLPKKSESASNRDILDRLQLQNPSLNAGEWHFVSRKVGPQGVAFVCAIDDTSLAAIKLLEGGMAYYRLQQVKIIVLDKQDAKDDSSKPASQ